jgi:pimeloyl-ACP methyl ester carboxylesterase
VSDHPVYIGGHSLGGQRTYQYAYSRLTRGLRVDGIYALAPPMPGVGVIGNTFRAHQATMSIRGLWNQRDIVPRVPVDMELLNEEFEQPWTLIETDEPPTAATRKFIDIDPYHNIALYVAGAKKIPDDPGVAIKLGDAADLIERLYNTADGWDWINPVNGSYFAMKIMPNGARLMIPRGTQTALEWLQDFDAFQIPVLGARMPRGGWSGVAAVQDQLDAQLA